MIRNNEVIIGIASTLKGTQGQILKTWDFGSVWDDSTNWDDVGYWVDDAVRFVCDVQPAVFNEYVYQNWGVSDLDSESKLMFVDTTLVDFWPLLDPFDRVSVVGGKIYDILGSNVWQKHKVCLLKPVQGEAA